jgi:hypothetical protein
MGAFALAWPDEPIVQQLVAQIPWGHNVRLLDLVKNQSTREWSARCLPAHLEEERVDRNIDQGRAIQVKQPHIIEIRVKAHPAALPEKFRATGNAGRNSAGIA